MGNALSDAWLTNGITIASFVIFLGFVGKQVLDWFRGDRNLENNWRSSAIQDAVQGHQVLKSMFETLQKQVSELEEDLQEAKKRESDLIVAHRQEIANLTQNYEHQIAELQAQIRDLKTRMERQENGGND